MAHNMLLEGVGCICNTDVCNLISLGWLFERPSVLLWADQVLVAVRDYEVLSLGYPVFESKLYGETVAALFEALSDEGIAKTFDPEPLLLPVSVNSICEQVESDLALYGTESSEPNSEGKIEPAAICSDEGRFCQVRLESMYTNLLLARLMGCSCLMDSNKARFVINRFGPSAGRQTEKGKAFDRLYSVIVPELNIRNYKLFCPESTRAECIHGDECARDIKGNIRRFIEDLLMVREKPEIKGLSKLVSQLEAETGGNVDEISHAALKDISRAQSRVLTLEGVKSWSSVVTDIASVAAASSFIAGDPIASSTAAAVASLGIMGSVAAESMRAMDSWKITYAEEYTKRIGS